RRIYEQTDGNPLFVVGVVDSLVSRGRIIDTAPGWVLTVPSETLDLDVPDDVRLLIESQLDGLSPGDRALLQAASVAGEDFSPLVIATALGQEEPDAEARCEALVRARRFLKTVGHVEWSDRRLSRRYAFSHDLYRQVVYGQISEGHFRRLHHRLAEALEAAYGARRREIAPRLAVHFERGRDDGRAIHYLIAAAAGARKRFANREAIGYLEAALAIVTLTPDGDGRRRQELEVRLALGPALSESHGPASEQSHENYERAFELSKTVGSPAQRLRILYARWHGYLSRGGRSEVLAMATEFEDFARCRGTAQDRLLADFLKLRTALYVGRFLEVERPMRRIARHASRGNVGDPIEYGADPLISAMGHHAVALWFLGDPERAQKTADEAVARARGAGHIFTLTAILNQYSLIHMFSRNAAESHELATEVAALSAKHGFPYWHAMATAVTGSSVVRQGQPREGIAMIERALTALLAIGTKFFTPTAYALLAEGYLAADDPAEGLAAAEKGLEPARTALPTSTGPHPWTRP